MKNLAYEAIDGLGLVLFVRLPVFIEKYLPCVDRCVVRFIIDDEERELRDNTSFRFFVDGICNVVLNPLQQLSENRLLLLDHKQPRTLFRTDGEMACDLAVEVSVIRASRSAVRMYGWVAVDFGYADWLSWVSGRGCLIAQKSFLKAYLCLGPEVVV
ncbi:MAG: hypothetical protein ACD_23C01377G0002 [uncultured bacterium]|nr:MAG: hypothetical protein ACD_23C01377G0002 [uncultured bacterium]